MKIKHILHEALFVILILFAIADFMELLPGEINVIKKVFSWVLVGYLLYYFSLTRILLNNKNKKVDLLLLLAFYFFAFKNLSHFVVNEELTFFSAIKTFLYRHQSLNEVMFFLGSASLLGLAVYIGFTMNYHPNSVLGVIKKPLLKKKFHDRVLDSLIVYSILLFFSYFIFTVVMEWFALAIDSYLIVGALAYYLVIFYILGTKRVYEPLVHMVVEAGDRLVRSFLELFHNRNTIYFGISGVIVIHSVIDIANFLIPYVLNFKNSFYLSALMKESHQTIFSLLFQDLAGSNILAEKIAVAYIYIQNIVAVFFLLFIPFFIWVRIFNKKPFFLKRWQLSLFFSSLFCLVLAPILEIGSLKNLVVTGVDITTHTLNTGPFFITVTISLLWFMIVYLLSGVEKVKKWIDDITIFLSLAFLGQYVYFFYNSTLIYYVTNIRYLFSQSKYLLVFYLSLYIIIITLFYISSFILFVFEVLNSEHVSFLRLNLNIKKEIIFVWSLFLLVGFIYLIERASLVSLVVPTIASLILSLVLFRYEKNLAGYILLINIVIDSFLILNVITNNLPLQDAWVEIINRIGLLSIVVLLMLTFKHTSKLKIHSVKRLAAALFLGIVFGLWFLFLREPTAPLIIDNIVYIVLFSFCIALVEELLFRLVIFRAASKIFSGSVSLIIQGLSFALLHLINFRLFMMYFGAVMLTTLFISLIIFGVLMALLNQEKENIVVTYSIIAHTIAVVILYVG